MPKRREEGERARHIIMKWTILKTIENPTAYKERLVVFLHLMFLLKILMSKLFMENKLHSRNIYPVKLTHDSDILGQSKAQKLAIRRLRLKTVLDKAKRLI